MLRATRTRIARNHAGRLFNPQGTILMMPNHPKRISCAVAAAALALGLTGAAAAAQVQVYGLVETGLNYVNIDAEDGKGSTSRFEQRAGQFIPSRWGLRGNEDLGNGWSVGFNLEGQFSADTGAMTGSRLFHRTAQVSFSGPYGEFVMGRSGLLRSGWGTTGIWGSKVNPFSSSVGQYLAGSKYLFPGDFKAADNTITYRTPEMAGWRLHAQYSGKIDQVANTTSDEFDGSADRIWSLGATYTQGPLHFAAVLDSIMYGSYDKATPTATKSNDAKDYDDSLALSLAATYDFGVLKLYTSAMWFDGMLGAKFQGHDFAGHNSMIASAAYQGWSVQVGSDVPAFGGTFKVNAGWMDAKADETKNDADVADTDRLALSTAYVHPLSKRTNVYCAAGYMRDTSNAEKLEGTHPHAAEFLVGMWHRF